jgi:hypothetical protein
MAFSVQFAAEPTSVAAPLTVLHAAMARHAPTNATATSFWTIIVPPFDVRNDNESPNSCLSSEPSAVAAIHCVLGAIRDRIDVAGRAADRVARRDGQSGAEDDHSGCLLEH